MIFKPKANEVSIDPSKSIAIVGNASSLLDHSFGQEIDSYDVIIRLNKGFIRNPESQGTRTDILGLSCKLTKKEFMSNFFLPIGVTLYKQPNAVTFALAFLHRVSR